MKKNNLVKYILSFALVFTFVFCGNVYAREFSDADEGIERAQEIDNFCSTNVTIIYDKSKVHDYETLDALLLIGNEAKSSCHKQLVQKLPYAIKVQSGFAPHQIVVTDGGTVKDVSTCNKNYKFCSLWNNSADSDNVKTGDTTWCDKDYENFNHAVANQYCFSMQSEDSKLQDVDNFCSVNAAYASDKSNLHDYDILKDLIKEGEEVYTECKETVSGGYSFGYDTHGSGFRTMHIVVSGRIVKQFPNCQNSQFCSPWENSYKNGKSGDTTWCDKDYENFKRAISDKYCYSIQNVIVDEFNCKSLKELWNVFIKWYDVAEIVMAVSLVILSLVEYSGVVMEGNQDAMKKANKHLVTRIIIFVIFALLPALLTLMIDLFLGKIITGEVCNLWP